jgi:hypothetical protein
MNMSKNYKKTILNEKNKAVAAVLLVILMLSPLMASLPAANAQTGITLSTMLYPYIGMGSPTRISWVPSPDILATDPAYIGKTSAWPDATITLTRPDNTIVILNGPIEIRGAVTASVGRESEYPTDFVLVYTPDMKGTWSINFTWPGDDTYARVSKVDTFTVGDFIPKRDSYAMLSLRPYPAIGIGQDLLVNAWITPPPFVQRDYYENYTFTIKKPNGDLAYQFSMPSEHPGTAWWQWAFDQTGNWTITFDFAGDLLTNPCTVTQTITVQNDPIPYPIDDTALPTDSWSFPINVYNRNWRNIAGPWLNQYYNSSSCSFNPYTEAPTTSHVLWKLPAASGLGGYIGATAAASGIFTTDAQYAADAPNIKVIMAGRGYYTLNNIIHCIDMQSGQELWSVNGTFSVGTERAPTERDRGYPVLYEFGSRFRVYDALTGQISLDVPGMAMVGHFWDDPYVVSYSGGRLIKWDTRSSTTTFAERVVWNITYPFKLTAPASAHAVIVDNLMIIRQFPTMSITTEAIGAINMTTGNVEYYTQIADDSDPSTWIYRQGPAMGSGYGLIYFATTADAAYMDPPNGAGGYVAFSTATGESAWVSESFDYPWGNFFAYMPQACGYGCIYVCSYAGIYALNVTNGEIVWHYSAGNSGMETPYNNWVFGSVGPVVGGGIVFAPSTEHSPQIYYRGEQLHAIDASTGDEVWSIMGNYAPTAIAYGTLVAQENANGFTYAFSKGNTTTTVDVTKLQVAKGETVGITGTILDASPAQAGTPCVSKESMTAQMEYLHMQQPKPTNVTGVPVTLTALKSDGTSVTIGTVTSNAYGTYTYQWNPTDQDTYTIVATFQGDDSYYSSYATAQVNVGPATTTSSASPSVPQTPSASTPASTTTPLTSPSTETTPPTTTPTQAPPSTQSPSMDTYIIVAAVIAIVAVVAAAVLLRRKKQ